ncbi:putative ABC transport system permease protein [Lachnospiraceae bacterium XBB2008]|nr:putative ABC transport system permease protein [Lachnospiraceae bacterium XBB2008]
MDTLREYIESAIKNIRSNRIRTLLTMLGIIIGIASVITILTIGGGMKEYVQQQFESVGSRMIDVYLRSNVTDQGFTNEDIIALMDEFPEVKGASYYFYSDGMSTARKGTFETSVISVNQFYSMGNTNGIKYGTFISEDEVYNSRRVCVLMAADAKRLFGTEKAVGMTLNLNVDGVTGEFTVIGVTEDYGEMIMKMMEMFGERSIQLYIPYTTSESLFNLDVSKAYDLEVYTDRADLNVSQDKIIRFLEAHKGLRGQDAIYSYNSNDDSEEIDQMMTLITTFMSMVAAISLLVGGIGVMNIMLVSVTERTREIGIRKSIGARTRSILIQFLAESSIITLIGGVFGIILGLVIAAVVCKLANFSYIVTPSSIIISTLFSSVIGIFFGIYPARKAAKLKPVDALSRRN